MNVFAGLGMKQLINEPTRIENNSSTTIDLIFSNIDMMTKVLHTQKITDHAIIECRMGSEQIKNIVHKKRIRNFRSFDESKFKERLRENFVTFNFNLNYDQDSETITNSNDKMNRYINIITETLDIEAPIKEVVFSRIE